MSHTITIVISLGILCEALAFLLWLREQVLLCPLLLHISASLFLSVGFILYKKKGQSIELSAVYFFVLLQTIFFPGFGLVMTILILIWINRYGEKLKSGIYGEYEDYIEEAGIQANVTGAGKAHFYQLQEMRSEVSFEPFVDIIRGNDNAIKQRAIEKLSRNISSQSVKILKMAVSDLSPEIRLSAANALLKIEKTINDKIQLAIRMTKQRGSAQDYTNLGDHYKVYATIGLMEKTTFQYYMSLACQAYQKSLDLDTNQADVVKDYTKSLIIIKDYSKANKLLAHSLKIWRDDKELQLLYIEVCFYMKNFSHIKASLSDLSSEALATQQKNAVDLWLT